MKLIARVALLAYPRQFRDRLGSEYLRHIGDLSTHHRKSQWQIGATVIGEVFTTAARMRWENLMPQLRLTLTITAAVVALASVVIGSPVIAVLVVAIVALAGLQFAGRDRPIAPTDPSITRRWYQWLAAAACAFLVGLGALAIDGDNDLSTPAWATWMLSWTAAALCAAIGVGLAATRLLTHRN